MRQSVIRASIIAFATMVSLCVFAITCTAAQPYTFIPLGNGTDWTYATAMNNMGQVVGFDEGPDGAVPYAVTWTNGVMQDLGVGTLSAAYGINDAGAIVGFGGPTGMFEKDGPTIIPYSLPQVFGVTPPRIEGDSINNAGTIAGAYYDPNGFAINGQAYPGYSTVLVWPASLFFTPVDLMLPDSANPQSGPLIDGQGIKINDAGQVILNEWVWTGTLWNLVYDLPGDSISATAGINNHGQVVGTSSNPDAGTSDGFLWQNNTTYGLPALAGQTSTKAVSINDSGQIVGTSGGQMVLWQHNTIQDLNPLISGDLSGWGNLSPVQINNSGWILGQGSYDGVPTPFLLVPTPQVQLDAGGGQFVVGGLSITLPGSSANGILSSTFTELQQDLLANLFGSTAADQINFALAGTMAQAWEITYTGTFSGMATVTIHYDPALLGNTPESSLEVAHFENGHWTIPANQVVDILNHTITFSTDGFSPFVLAIVPEPSTWVLAALATAGLYLTYCSRESASRSA